MFEPGQHKLPSASPRLKQDMAGEASNEPAAVETVESRPAEQVAPLSSIARVQAQPDAAVDAPAGTEVQVAPFAPSIEGPPAWPYWAAVGAFVGSAPPAVFWLLSLLYVLGAPKPFIGLMSMLPTWLAVVTAFGLPVMSLAAAILALSRTSVGDRGRPMAWLALVAAGAFMLGLGLWLTDEYLSLAQ